MALGEFRLFQFKSKSQIKNEEREYANWAFPYGDLQRNRLTNLIKELDPKATVSLSLATFLTCKELYERKLDETGSREEAVYQLINVVKSYNQLIRKNEMTFYLALVLADADINDNCEYPAADILHEKINELEAVRIVRKGWRATK